MRRNLRHYLFVTIAAVWLAALCAHAGAAGFAQSAGATLKGTVVGPSEEAAAGARVKVAAVGGEDAPRTATTDGAGVYSFASLPPGSYRVTVETEGFKTIVVENLQLAAGDTQSLKFTLEEGGAQEVIVIPAENPPATASFTPRRTRPPGGVHET